MHALIYEPAHGGHHLHYVRVLTQGLLDLGLNVTWALSKSAPSSQEFAVHLAHLAHRVQLTTPTHGPQGLGFKTWKQVGSDLIHEVQRLQPDRVFLPYTGGLPLALGTRLRPWPFPKIAIEGLVMRGGWAYPQPNFAAAARQKALLATCCRVPWDRLHLLDPLPYFWMKKHGKLAPDRYALIPEPVEPLPAILPSEARQRLGLPTDGHWAVVTGQQDSRKGVDRLLAAYARAEIPDNARLLLAGKASDEIRDWIASEGRTLVEQGKLHQIDRYLSEEEFDLALNAADVMVAPHFRPVGSSGLLVRAAALGKTVLSTDYGWTGWATKTFGLGTTVNIENSRAYADSLTGFFRAPPTFGNAHTNAFVAYHTFDNHLAHWLVRTRAALGQPADPGCRSWDDLLPPNTLEAGTR